MTQTAPRQHADAAPISADPLRAFIDTCLRRRQTPLQIIDAVKDTFGIAIDYGQVIPCWKGEITIPTQTEHRPDKESVQFAADAPQEPEFTRIAEDETPGPISATLHRLSEAAAGEDDAPATQTGRRQNQDSLQIPADPVDDPTVTREALEEGFEALGALAMRRLGIVPHAAEDADPAEGAADAPAEDAATQTGRRQNQKTKCILTDEQKAFVVRGLARYETPTRVAASFKAQFGIAIDRRQVYAYDPAGSRPPAQRWIDLYAVTRAKFLGAAAEIGVAQKVVRLRMLDRFANRCEESNSMAQAARFLEQAAKECGGFYERYARPKGVGHAYSR